MEDGSRLFRLISAARATEPAGFAESLCVGSEKILLVEDAAFVRNAAAEVLESAGYRVVIAGCSAEALEACRGGAKPADLLLADVVLPGGNGREFAKEFQRLCPGAPVLLMTGYPEQLNLCEASGESQPYLAKPFSSRVLLRKVREVLGANLGQLQAQA